MECTVHKCDALPGIAWALHAGLVITGGGAVASFSYVMLHQPRVMELVGGFLSRSPCCYGACGL